MPPDVFRRLILEQVPADGTTIGNIRLRKLITQTMGHEVDATTYAQIRDDLVDEGVLIRGPGRGGSLRLADGKGHASDDLPRTGDHKDQVREGKEQHGSQLEMLFGATAKAQGNSSKSGARKANSVVRRGSGDGLNDDIEDGVAIPSPDTHAVKEASHGLEGLLPRSFERDGQRIVWGDVTAALDTAVADASVDLVFADPPYNIGKHFGDFVDRWPSDAEYVRWCNRWLECCIRKLKPSGSLYLMSSTQAMPLLDAYLRERMSILSRIVWHYDSSGVQARRYFGSMYEPILFCVRDTKNYVFNADDIKVEARTGSVRKLIDYRKSEPTPYNTKKVPGNVWYFPRVRYRMDEYEDHPSQKPEILLERIIKASTNPDALVLDPFAGTFTAGAVAKRLGRRSISFELNEDYVRAGIRRLGIATTLDGKTLERPNKSYVRRNGKSAEKASNSPRPLGEETT